MFYKPFPSISQHENDLKKTLKRLQRCIALMLFYIVLYKKEYNYYTCIYMYTFKWVEIMNKCLYIDLKHASYLHF